MVVANYRIKRKISKYLGESLEPYKFKTSYDFLKQYFNDECPFTINKAGLHCKSNKRRSYYDLAALAREHTKNFKINKFHKDFIRILYELKIGFVWCPWVATVVFSKILKPKVHFKKKFGYYIKSCHIEERYTGGDQFRYLITRTIFIDYLKFNEIDFDNEGYVILKNKITKRKLK